MTSCMELSKRDTQMAKGMAVLGMVMLHLFCRTSDLPYTPLIWCGDTPLIYFLGLFGDLCVHTFCFCSGYAHYLLADTQKADYPRRIPGKALRLLCNYWIVVVLFSGVGLLLGRSDIIPGSWSDFAGSLLLITNHYNGAWWFVTTYLVLLVLSSRLAGLVKRTNGIMLLILSLILYFISYLFRFVIADPFPEPVSQWVWNQLVLLANSQFCYLIGMVCRKYELIGRLREYLVPRTALRRSIVFGLPVCAFLGHCIIQSVFVSPFTAMAAMTGLFLANHPRRIERGLLLLGKHSTNIWLVHMFFYENLFPGLVFLAKYPVLILALMLSLCFAASAVIDLLHRQILRMLDR